MKYQPPETPPIDKTCMRYLKIKQPLTPDAAIMCENASIMKDNAQLRRHIQHMQAELAQQLAKL